MFKNKVLIQSLVGIQCWMQLTNVVYASPVDPNALSPEVIELSQLGMNNSTLITQYRGILDLAKQTYTDASIQALNTDELVEQFGKTGIDSPESNELLYFMRKFLENGHGLEEVVDRVTELNSKEKAAKSVRDKMSSPYQAGWKVKSAAGMLVAVSFCASIYVASPIFGIDCGRSEYAAITRYSQFVSPNSLQIIPIKREECRVGDWYLDALTLSGMRIRGSLNDKCYDFTKATPSPAVLICMDREQMDFGPISYQFVSSFTESELKNTSEYKLKLGSLAILGGVGVGIATYLSTSRLIAVIRSSLAKYYFDQKANQVSEVRSKIFKDLHKLTGIPALPELLQVFVKNSKIEIVIDQQDGHGIEHAAGTNATSEAQDEEMDGPRL